MSCFRRKWCTSAALKKMQKTIFFSNDTIKHLHQKLKRQQTGSFSETPEISEIAQSIEIADVSVSV